MRVTGQHEIFSAHQLFGAAREALDTATNIPVRGILNRITNEKSFDAQIGTALTAMNGAHRYLTQTSGMDDAKRAATEVTSTIHTLLGKRKKPSAEQLRQMRTAATVAELLTNPRIDRAAVEREMRKHVFRAPDEIQQNGLDELATLVSLPPRLLPQFPISMKDSYHTLVSYVHQGRNLTRDSVAMRGVDRIKLHFEIADRAAAGVPSRAELTETVRTIVSKPTELISDNEIRELATIVGLPGHLRPKIPAQFHEMYLPLPDLYAVNSGSWRTHNPIVAHLDGIRLWLQRDELAGRADITPAYVTSRLREISSIPRTQRTMDNVSELAILLNLRDVQLPAGLRNAIDVEPVMRQALLGGHPDTTAVESSFAVIRRWLHRVDVAASPSVSRESATAEYQSILLAPLDNTKSDALEKLANLEFLPPHLRPTHSGPADAAWPLHRIIDSEPVATTRTQLLHEISHLRSLLIFDHPGGTDALREYLATGNTIDGGLLHQIVDGGDSLLKKLGVSYRQLLDRPIELPLATKKDMHSVEVLTSLKRALENVEGLTEQEMRLRNDIFGIIDTNIRRLDGSTHDGFGGYIEFAEQGRLKANLEMLRISVNARLGPATPPAPTNVTPSPSAVTSGQLTW